GFGDRQSRLGDLTIDIAGTDKQEGTVEPGTLEGLQQVQGAQQVDLQRMRRVLEGRRHEGLPGQVNHRIRYARLQPGIQGGWIQQVVRFRSQQLPGFAARYRVLQMPADKATESGNQ